MNKKNVLIYPCGAENALEVYAAIRHSVHIKVTAATSKEDHSDLIYDCLIHKLPNVFDENFISEINKLIEDENIDLIFPTHDTVSLYLAKYQEAIKAKVITSDYITNEVCRYKSKTYKLFSSECFTPSVYDTTNFPTCYPVFAKPNVGEGAKGVFKINTQDEFKSISEEETDLVFVEYLPGREFTVDCFTDRKGNLLFYGARERVQISMGISFHNREFEATEELSYIANKINSQLKLRGLWFFQVKEDINGKLKLLEISTRVAGSMGFFRQKGVNLPLLSIFDALNIDIEIQPNNYKVELFRSTVNRYKLNISYQNIYIDFDDTLIVDGKVNLTLLKFIYQSIEKSKNIYLITKHAEDIFATLRKFKINPEIFDEIYVLKSEDKKYELIEPRESIFIDNWYLERKEVKEKLGIPVFDVDAVDSLIKG